MPPILTRKEILQKLKEGKDEIDLQDSSHSTHNIHGALFDILFLSKSKSLFSSKSSPGLSNRPQSANSASSSMFPRPGSAQNQETVDIGQFATSENLEDLQIKLKHKFKDKRQNSKLINGAIEKLIKKIGMIAGAPQLVGTPLPAVNGASTPAMTPASVSHSTGEKGSPFTIHGRNVDRLSPLLGGYHNNQNGMMYSSHSSPNLTSPTGNRTFTSSLYSPTRRSFSSSHRIDRMANQTAGFASSPNLTNSHLYTVHGDGIQSGIIAMIKDIERLNRDSARQVGIAIDPSSHIISSSDTRTSPEAKEVQKAEKAVYQSLVAETKGKLKLDGIGTSPYDGLTLTLNNNGSAKFFRRRGYDDPEETEYLEDVRLDCYDRMQTALRLNAQMRLLNGQPAQSVLYIQDTTPEKYRLAAEQKARTELANKLGVKGFGEAGVDTAINDGITQEGIEDYIKEYMALFMQQVRTEVANALGVKNYDPTAASEINSNTNADEIKQWVEGEIDRITNRALDAGVQEALTSLANKLEMNSDRPQVNNNVTEDLICAEIAKRETASAQTALTSLANLLMMDNEALYGAGNIRVTEQHINNFIQGAVTASAQAALTSLANGLGMNNVIYGNNNRTVTEEHILDEINEREAERNQLQAQLMLQQVEAAQQNALTQLANKLRVNDYNEGDNSNVNVRVTQAIIDEWVEQKKKEIREAAQADLTEIANKLEMNDYNLQDNPNANNNVTRQAILAELDRQKREAEAAARRNAAAIPIPLAEEFGQYELPVHSLSSTPRTNTPSSIARSGSEEGEKEDCNELHSLDGDMLDGDIPPQRRHTTYPFMTEEDEESFNHQHPHGGYREYSGQQAFPVMQQPLDLGPLETLLGEFLEDQRKSRQAGEGDRTAQFSILLQNINDLGTRASERSEDQKARIDGLEQRMEENRKAEEARAKAEKERRENEAKAAEEKRLKEEEENRRKELEKEAEDKENAKSVMQRVVEARGRQLRNHRKGQDTREGRMTQFKKPLTEEEKSKLPHQPPSKIVKNPQSSNISTSTQTTHGRTGSPTTH